MAWCRPHDWSLASANVGAQTLLFLHIRHSKDQWQSKINNIRESTVWKKNIRNRWPHPLLRIGFCVCVGAGVPILRYINISILIKYSNFSRFHKKKLGPFYKKLRCNKFGNWSISIKNAMNNQIQSSMKLYMYIVWNCCLPIADFETTGVQFHENAHFL